MFVMFYYTREITVMRSCKYGEYGLLDHLLFWLFVFVFVFVLIDMSNIWICVVSRCRRRPSCMAKTFLTFDVTRKLFNQVFFFIPAMVVGTIDCCHCVPRSITLTLAGGHKVSTKRNLLVYFLAHFSTDQDET